MLGLAVRQIEPAAIATVELPEPITQAGIHFGGGAPLPRLGDIAEEYCWTISRYCSQNVTTSGV